MNGIDLLIKLNIDTDWFYQIYFSLLISQLNVFRQLISRLKKLVFFVDPQILVFFWLFFNDFLSRFSDMYT